MPNLLAKRELFNLALLGPRRPMPVLTNLSLYMLTVLLAREGLYLQQCRVSYSGSDGSEALLPGAVAIRGDWGCL